MDQENQQAVDAVDRNHAEAVLDALYGVCINSLSCRLYRRIDSVFSLVNVLGGSAAFATVLADKAGYAGALGLTIAALAYLEREIKPGQKAVQCQVQAERFGDLASRASDLSLREMDGELRRLQATGPDTFDSLRITAYNDNVSSNGFSQFVIPPSRWERLIAWIV